MSKKIILFALAAASLAAFALPATALAAEEDEAVHVTPNPIGSKAIHGEGKATLTSAFAAPVECTSFSGTAEFTTTTTGTIEQTFNGCTQSGAHCTTAGQPTGTITTEKLQFHFVTVVHEHNAAISGPGILITTNAGTFAQFMCSSAVTVGGNGLVGTITKPKCGETSPEMTISFISSSTGKQTHTTVLQKDPATGKTGTTATNYSLTAFNFVPASEDASGTITYGPGPPDLVCT